MTGRDIPLTTSTWQVERRVHLGQLLQLIPGRRQHRWRSREYPAAAAAAGARLYFVVHDLHARGMGISDESINYADAWKSRALASGIRVRETSAARGPLARAISVSQLACFKGYKVTSGSCGDSCLCKLIKTLSRDSGDFESTKNSTIVHQ